MSDKYYRLVTFVLDICPRPLRELLITKAKADSSTGVPFTSLDAYLNMRKSDVVCLLNKHIIWPSQYALIYPSTGSFNVNSWDVTLLAVLLQQLFRNTLSASEKQHIKAIWDTRNELQHIASSNSLDDKDFNNHWTVLDISVNSLATCTSGGLLSNLSNDISEALTGNIPNLGDVIRTWYLQLNVELRQEVTCLKNKMDQLQVNDDQLRKDNALLLGKVNLLQDTNNQIQRQNKQLQMKVDHLQNTIDSQKDEMNAIKAGGQKTNTILNKVTSKRKGRGGIAVKKIKVTDCQVEKMRETLARSMKKLQKKNDTSHSDCIEQIKQQLADNHRVIVTGYDNDLTYKCAVAAVVSMNYQSDQCLEINNPSDWKKVCSDDAQLVVFKEPFGRQTYDAQRVSVMMDEFDSMLELTSDDEDVPMDIIIVTNQNLLDRTRKNQDHDMMTSSCTVYVESEHKMEGFERMSDDRISQDNSLIHPSVTDINNPVPGVLHQHVWSVASKQNYNIKMAGEDPCYIIGCCQLPTGGFLLTDYYNKRLKKLDAGYRVIGVYDVPDRPRDVCYIGMNEAVVALDKTLQFVDVTGMTLTRSVSTEHVCRGLTCHGDQLYVIDRNTVYMYSTRGIKQRVLYTHTDYSMSSMVMSDDGSKMYIACLSELITIDSSGNLLSTFSDPVLRETMAVCVDGMLYAGDVCVDGEGHVLVSYYSGRILQISSDGKHKLGTITNISEDKVCPLAICFDRHKSVLTCAGISDNVIVLQLK